VCLPCCTRIALLHTYMTRASTPLSLCIYTSIESECTLMSYLSSNAESGYTQRVGTRRHLCAYPCICCVRPCMYTYMLQHSAAHVYEHLHLYHSASTPLSLCCTRAREREREREREQVGKREKESESEDESESESERGRERG